MDCNTRLGTHADSVSRLEEDYDKYAVEYQPWLELSPDMVVKQKQK